MGTGDPAQIRLRGAARRRDLIGAVLALTGASPAELKRAHALTGGMTDRCFVVAVDGGIHACRRARIRPELYVGDGDSSGRIPRGLPAVTYDRDKDFSDLGGALCELRRRKVRIAGLAGLVGGRLDHEWANLFELGRHARHFAGFLAPTGRGTVVVTAKGCRVTHADGRPFSLFALGASAVVTLSGARWTLERRLLAPGSRGLSNVGCGELDLAVHRGVAALLLLPS